MAAYSVQRMYFLARVTIAIGISATAGTQETLQQVRPSSDPTKAVLRVHGDRRLKYPISRYLTGKFCEHLHNNVINGMEAQILRNPTFADYQFRRGEGIAP